MRALDAYIKLVRSADSVSARIHAAILAEGLTESQFGVLEALLHLGPLTQCEIARKLLKSGGNITMVIDNLEKRGLARRTRSPKDRRYVTVRLTEAGKVLIEGIFPAHVQRVLDAMGRLTGEEQELLDGLCRKLGRGETREDPDQA